LGKWGEMNLERKCLRCSGRMEFGRIMATPARNFLAIDREPAPLKWAAETDSWTNIFRRKGYGMDLRAFMCQNSSFVQVVREDFVRGSE
jgi:hypothetical protein